MTELSKFYSEDEKRRADVEYTGNGYLVTLYINEQVYQKRTASDEDTAESMAEEFVLSKTGPGLLNEDLVGPADC